MKTTWKVWAGLAGLAAIAAGAVAATGAGVPDHAEAGAFLAALRAAVAGAVAVGVAALALTLPGLSVRGFVLGGTFTLAGMLSWSYQKDPLIIWAVLGLGGLAFAVWSYPWWRDLPKLLPLGGAWLGVAYWLLGIVGALLMVKFGIAAQRIGYAGVFGLGALATIAVARRPAEKPSDRKDPTVSIAAVFLLAIAALFLFGSGNVLSGDHHVVPPGPWGEHMEYRFWGASFLLYHPNSLALIAVVAAIRIAPDPAFALWQRLGTLALVVGVLLLTNSRTAFGFLAAAGLVHGLLILRRRISYPTNRAKWTAIALPFVACALVFALSGGTNGFLLVNRYSEGGVTSGRMDTWKQVVREWRDGPVAEKLFGSTYDSRATVNRADSVQDPTKERPKLTTDNAAVGALRRGGALGVIAFLLGLGLLLLHAVRGSGERRPAPWLTIAAVGAIPTIATADWLLGGTGGTLWILLLAGEAWLLFGPAALPGVMLASGPDTAAKEPKPSNR